MPKTKRAPSAYNLFVRDAMESLKSNSSLSHVEKMKECSQKWKNVDDETKARYAEQAKLAKEEMVLKRQRETEADDIHGAIATMEDAIASMRSSAKKKQLQECLEKVKQYA